MSEDFRADLISYHARSIAKYVLEQMAQEYERAIISNSTEEARESAARSFMTLSSAANIVSGELCAEADREAKQGE